MDFGFLFSRVCFHFGLSYRELIALPMKTFWMLNKNINRLLAEKDLRALSVAAAAHAGAEAYAEVQTRLSAELDEPYKGVQKQEPQEEEFDRNGFELLRLMAQGKA